MRETPLNISFHILNIDQNLWTRKGGICKFISGVINPFHANHEYSRFILFYYLIQSKLSGNEMKWNESGFRPPLCTYRLNWARRTSWGWWDDWDDTVLQTQDSKFEPWRSEAEHATSRSRRLPTILTFTRGWGRNIFLFLSNRRDREPNPELWRERQRC